MSDTNVSSGVGSSIAVSTEVVLFTIRDDSLHVLLAAANPGWRLPGDLVQPHEALDEAARRALAAVAGPSGVWLEQLYTFGDLDPLNASRVISVAHYALVAAEAVQHLRATDAQWWPVAALPLLSTAHRRITEYALARLRNKLAYTTVGFQLLPQRFTLSELQRVYEIILGRALDKRNFRRKVELLQIVKPTREQRATGAGRPAQLYRFVADEAPEAIGGPEPLAASQQVVQLARIGPVLRRRGRVVQASTLDTPR